jgi:hypothetical protein
MAIERGHRFSAEFDVAFGDGLIQTSDVEADREYTGDPNKVGPQKVDEATGLRIWKFRALDPGQKKVKQASFEVKLIATHQPVPEGPELMPGMRRVVLEGLMVEPKVIGQGEYKSQGYAFWASGFAAVDTGSGTGAGSVKTEGASSEAGKQGSGKAA